MDILGGTVSDAAGSIGGLAGASGTVTISGGSWTNSETITVGGAGTGELDITGGTVYRGKQVPELFGKYVFADYVKAQVYALTYDESTGKATAVQRILGNNSPVFTFGEDEQGELYFGALNNTLQRFSPGSK